MLKCLLLCKILQLHNATEGILSAEKEAISGRTAQMKGLEWLHYSIFGICVVVRDEHVQLLRNCLKNGPPITHNA